MPAYEKPFNKSLSAELIVSQNQYLEFFFQETGTECQGNLNDNTFNSGSILGFVEIEGNNITITFPESSKGNIQFTGSISNGNFDVISSGFGDFIGLNDECPVTKTIEIIGNISGNTLTGNYVVTVDISNDSGCSLIVCNDPYEKSGNVNGNLQ
jgi:hypothetical protein